jgi:hypothetical protein
MYSPHDVIGKLSKASPRPKREYKQFLRMVIVMPTLAYASSGIVSPIATGDAGGSEEVTIVKKTAHNGFVRGSRSQLFVYPGGSYCEEHDPENATMMDSTGTRDAHGRAVSI